MDKENIQPNRTGDFNFEKLFKKREDFAISLRNSKRKEILKVKRRKNINFYKEGCKIEIVNLIELFVWFYVQKDLIKSDFIQIKKTLS